MAAEPEEVTAEAGGGSKKKLFIIIGAGVVALIAVVVVLFFVLTGGDDSGSSSSSASSAQTEDNTGEAMYVAMPRDMIFNVPGARRDRMAQIGVQLLVRGPRNEMLAQENIPLLEATLLDVFSRATAERLNTPEGKREIRLQALDAVRQVMREATDGSPVVEEVLFTGFVLQ
ncbi:MAG: flagellar basal body-associated protein FliL [Idiomarina sp.]|nr:flagellar basal body-associated protein FliL [Idiomarina sp.]